MISSTYRDLIFPICLNHYILYLVLCILFYIFGVSTYIIQVFIGINKSLQDIFNADFKRENRKKLSFLKNYHKFYGSFFPIQFSF
jgi:hypothetical protein